MTKPQTEHRPLPGVLPFVSVVLPIRNEAKFIEATLRAVLQQEYPAAEMEVLIADGMSNDRTRDIIRRVAATYPHQVRIIDNPGKIVATGLNAAIAEARGKIVVRVDGHCIVAPDYVRTSVETLERSSAVNVGGQMESVSDGRVGRAVALATSSTFGVGGALKHYRSTNERWVDTVFQGAWRRTVFETLGNFDEELVRNQDDEFNYRIRSRGGKILFNPKIKSRYYNRGDLGSLWRQYFQYGYWKVRVLQKHPAQMQPRQFVPAGFVATLLLSLLLSPFASTAALIFGLVLGLYLLANLVASAMVARRGDWGVTLLLPVVFATIHFAYGSGFLKGLFSFRHRWPNRRSQRFAIERVAGNGAGGDRF
jgi:succinoglycan biosynthesis protein ExoA